MRRKNKHQVLGKVQEQVAVKVAAGLLSIQKRWAGFMFSLFAGMSQRKQIAIFLFVGVALLCYNSNLIYHSIAERSSNRKAIIPTEATTPTLNKVADPIRLNAEQSKKLLFLGDSLRKIGGKQWKKFAELYPGIADSIAVREAGSRK